MFDYWMCAGDSNHHVCLRIIDSSKYCVYVKNSITSYFAAWAGFRCLRL